MKLRIHDDYTIHFPIQVCEPLNADFDGDTVNIQLVAPDVAEDTCLKMSPRYVTTYKKSGQTIYPFNHETLNGLAVATEYTGEPEELDSPRHYYTDYVQLLKDVEVEKKIKVGTPITFTGKIGGVEYKSKRTSYGRLRISKILDADVDLIGIFDKDTDRITAKAAGKLSTYLTQFPDGVEKRKELTKFALRVVSLAGVVTFDFKTLYTDTNTKLYKEICDIADSKDLTDKQKLLILTEKYAQYEKEIENSFSDDLKNELSRANRVKLSSISALNMPQLIVSGVDEKPVITRSSLLMGYGEQDFRFHSIS